MVDCAERAVGLYEFDIGRDMAEVYQKLHQLSLTTDLPAMMNISDQIGEEDPLRSNHKYGKRNKIRWLQVNISISS